MTETTTSSVELAEGSAGLEIVIGPPSPDGPPGLDEVWCVVVV